MLIFNSQSEVDHIIELKVKRWTSLAIFQADKTCIIYILNRTIRRCIVFETAIQFLFYIDFNRLQFEAFNLVCIYYSLFLF